MLSADKYAAQWASAEGAANDAPITASQQGPAFEQVSTTGFMASTAEAVAFTVKPLLPRRHVTLFGGHGGIGKSQLALAMAAHVAAGVSFAGFEVAQGKALFVSLEDEASVVLVRLRKIAQAYRLDAELIEQNLTILDGTKTASALIAEPDGYGSAAIMTKAFGELVGAAEGFGLVVIDNASDAFDADENKRRTVRRFVKALAAMARKHDCAVMLLAHIDKSAARNGSQGNSYSGSTAWHNSARSRLALMLDGESQAIMLNHEKANLSALAEPVSFVFDDGVLMPDDQGREGDQLSTANFDQAQMLRCFEAMADLGEQVPDNTGPSPYSAMAAFERLLGDSYPQQLKGKKGKQRAAQAIAKLKQRGVVVVEQYKTADWKRKTRLVLSGGEPANDCAY